MVKIALCDDNTNNLKYISKLIESQIISSNFEADIVFCSPNQNELKEKIKNKEIDVLFLDIDFGTNAPNGIELANELRKYNKDFLLIFVTAFFEYSLMAYNCKTFAYVLKPVTAQTIANTLARLKAEFSQGTGSFIQLNKCNSIRTKDILFIERNKSKAKVYTPNSVYETNYSLNTILDVLPKDFIRVHRSYIVNQNNIRSIDKNEKIIVFANNLSCPLGQFKSL